MNVFKADKIIDRLDKMIDNAMNNQPIENSAQNALYLRKAFRI